MNGLGENTADPPTSKLMNMVQGIDRSVVCISSKRL